MGLRYRFRKCGFLDIPGHNHLVGPSYDAVVERVVVDSRAMHGPVGCVPGQDSVFGVLHGEGEVSHGTRRVIAHESVETSFGRCSGCVRYLDNQVMCSVGQRQVD